MVEWRTFGHLTHGDTAGGRCTKEFIAWCGMLQRCSNPKTIGYAYYGGRGIRVCERWRDSFENFLADVGRAPSPAHSLDRYPDNDGNYESGNVRWATPLEQRWNRRRHFAEMGDGTKRPIADLARYMGVDVDLVSSRVRLGWTVGEAIARPKLEARRVPQLSPEERERRAAHMRRIRVDPPNQTRTLDDAGYAIATRPSPPHSPGG